MQRTRLVVAVALAAAAAACAQGSRDLTAPGLSAQGGPRFAAGTPSNAAVVIRGPKCDLGPGKGAPIPGTDLTFAFAYDGVTHQTESASGNYTVHCSAPMDPADERPKQAVVLKLGPNEAYNCFIIDSDGTHIFPGTSGQQIWTPSGQVIGKCTFKAKKAGGA